MQSRSRNEQQPHAIVVGLDDARGVYAARTLARHKVPIIAIAKEPKGYACRTKACQQILAADTASEELIRALEALGPTLDQKAVLVPCLDMCVLLISRHRQELERWYHIALPEPAVVEMLIDKVGFYTYAAENGFPIPQTYFLRSRADVEQAIKELSFPCALKPASSKTPRWLAHTHLKAFKIASAPELRDAVEQHQEYTNTLIAQEWIEGGDDSLYTSFCYFNTASEPLATFTSRKLRQWPPETGDASLAEECSNDVVLGETIRLFQSANFHGLGYVEIKRDERSGRFLIVEPNIGRTAAWMAIAEAGGVELLYTMYCDCVGAPLPAKREQSYTGPKWMYLRKDIQSAVHYWLRGDLTMREWWRSWRGRKVDALLSWTDLGPFIGDLQNALHLSLSTSERLKRLAPNTILAGLIMKHMVDFFQVWV